MKTLKFERITETLEIVTIKVKNEDLFKEKIIEWCSEGQSLNPWDLEEEHFSSVIDIDYYLEDTHENCDEFYSELENQMGIDDDWLEQAENGEL